ncbi:YdiU family protein [Curvibacter sp. HBC61]|uniref:Protein nucleotidyltransferase YdiU n=1 Tax=Curvibacter cyanobacteriorum TaxID=3026422 RepID=A0ABT5MUI9_9BURK|nr:YdiU family protein [Curvibacter sp. HBC61]MDD0837560.1 YdiU family protein [Curvibacter sp. HBC61]
MSTLDLAPARPSDASAAPPANWPSRLAQLGPAFSTALQPTPLPQPHWVAYSPAVAQALGLDPAWLGTDEALQVLTGNALLPGMKPLASVYSGHQFGVWAGQLGDGRAILLGETPQGHELQLKGSGRTPYSRGGDGRAVLRSSIREFLCSEAMHGLGIPTSRALSVTGSPAPVRRETIETAAVVARSAPSFLRFGHLEHFAARNDLVSLRQLADEVIDQHYPDCRDHPRWPGQPFAALLEAVSERTAALLAQWQAVGFCHGVMNTDNMSLLGLTLDYGPFQFLDAFDPGHICNHSDTQGRYAHNKQPNIAYWNLFCLAQALLPLIGDEDTAVAALESYKSVYPAAFEARLRAKLGWHQAVEGDTELIEGVLQLLAQNRVDYTIFWRRLSQAVAQGDFEPVRDLVLDRPAFDAWCQRYQARAPGADADLMLRSNPKFVLRNHLGELAIRQAQNHDFSGVQTLLKLLERPFEEHPGFEAYADFPPDWASSIEISCSS